MLQFARRQPLFPFHSRIVKAASYHFFGQPHILSRVVDLSEKPSKPKKPKAKVINYIRTTDEQVELLRLYKKFHGDVIVKLSFVVPDSPPWPFWAYHYPLGALVCYLRQFHTKHMKGKIKSKIHPSTYNTLDELGFVWNVPKNRNQMILSAFQYYKSIHGNLNIPIRFKIPEEPIPEGEEAVAFQPTWPMELWGMKLGQVVMSMRGSPTAYADIRTDIESLGFHFNSPNHTIEDILESLRVYKSIYGHLTIPVAYTIPFDDPRFPSQMLGKSLGEIARAIRLKGTYAEHFEALEEVGFIFSEKWKRYQQIYKALQIFKKRYGHVQVPYSYIIPFPTSQEEDTKDSMPSKQSEEEEEETDDDDDKKEQNTTKKRVNKSVIPIRNTPYPEETWGIALGAAVKRIRLEEAFKEYHAELIRLGLDIKQPEDPSKKKIFQAFRVNKERTSTSSNGCSIFSTTTTTTTNPVTSSSSSPTLCMPIDDSTSSSPSDFPSSSSSSSSSKRVQNFEKRFQSIFQSLLVYKQQHGDLLVPRNFIIPLDALAYPASLRGKCLGQMVQQLRHAEEFRKFQSQLLEIGFVYDIKYYEFIHVILTASQTYESLHGRGSIHSIALKYRIAEDDSQYPIQCRGVKLGTIINSLKHGKGYTTYYDQFMSVFPPPTKKLPYRLQFRKQLELKKTKKKMSVKQQVRTEEDEFEDELNEVPAAYDWDTETSTSTENAASTTQALSRDEKFVLLKESLQVYLSIHRNLTVPTAYIIPVEDKRYPEYMRGKALGNILANLRAKQMYQASHYQDELKKIGFVITSLSDQRAFMVIKAVKEYRDSFGNVDIPKGYVIPSTTPAPERSITEQEHSAQDELPSKQIRKNIRSIQKQEMLETKETYSVIEPPTPTVTFRGFSKELHGMKLGEITSQIRNGKTYKRFAYRFRQLGIPVVDSNKD